MKNFNLIIIGPQGSGKGTQAEILAKKFDMEIIGPGDLAREEVEKKSEFSKKLNDFLKKGKLWSDNIVQELLERKIKTLRNKKIIFDGFPRTYKQTFILEYFIKEYLSEQPIVIDIKLSEKSTFARLSNRRVCPKCNRIYSLAIKDLNKSVCEKCGEKLIQREDDKPNAIKKRLEIFYSETKPLIDYYKKNYQYIEINGELTIDQVSKEILEKLNPILES
jgi:adenylate kinase